MRALLLIALLVPAAVAQDVQVLPGLDGPATLLLFDEDRCDAPHTMPTPFAVDPGAAAVEAEMDGPTPVPMPNLCAEAAAPLAALPSGPIPMDRFLDRYRELLPEGSDVFDLLGDPSGWPEAPVAPPGDRE